LPADRSVLPAGNVFGALDDLRQAGKIRNYGVSVEKVEEALKAIEYPGVATVQIIYNIFRQRPHDLFFAEAQPKNVGVIVRVPLASGLLSGKITADTKFADDDHRKFNRNGEFFDVGETFAGVPLMWLSRPSSRCGLSCHKTRRWRSSRLPGSL
jgi:aryl-alcohol dehydrogenase-like predicted oxidoreductase